MINDVVEWNQLIKNAEDKRERETEIESKKNYIKLERILIYFLYLIPPQQPKRQGETSKRIQ